MDEVVCQEYTICGTRCGVSFKRRWNLKRHIEQQHHRTITTFIADGPVSKRVRLERLRNNASNTSLARPTPSFTATPARWEARFELPRSGASSITSNHTITGEILPNQRPPSIEVSAVNEESRITTGSRSTTQSPTILSQAPSNSMLSLSTTPSMTWSSAIGISMSKSLDRATETAHFPPVLGQPSPQSIVVAPLSETSSELFIPDSANSQSSTTDFQQQPKASTEASPRAMSHSCSRVLQAATGQPLPIYDIKSSKKYLQQERGLDWLTFQAKRAFDRSQEILLSQWGVKPGHKGTCILCPEDWRLHDPLSLEACIAEKRLPKPGTPRATYSYSDHTTSWARAAVWFGQWPRSGIELDNFLGCGPFTPMDASHLCHHDHCIVHVVYEPAHINLSRCACKARAVWLRQEGKDVPEHCSEHNPPCMMQHASLTSTECYHIQFSVLRQARGLPPLPEVPRPRRYLYPAFENKLPSLYPAIAPELEFLTLPLDRKNADRPTLCCKFCSKNFASVYGHWSHVFNKHLDIPDQDRLEEIRQTAALWRTYWDTSRSGGKKDNKTMSKLQQIEQADFNWSHVQAWGLN